MSPLQNIFPSEIYIYSSQTVYLQFRKSRILNGFHNVGSDPLFGFLCKARTGIRHFNLPASFRDHAGDRNVPWRCTVRTISEWHFPQIGWMISLGDWLGKKAFIYMDTVIQAGLITDLIQYRYFLYINPVSSFKVTLSPRYW